jgi:hypothetical protein
VIKILNTLALLGFLAAQFVGPGASSGAVTTISPKVEDPLTGKIYQLLSNANWTDSEAAAQALGGHLATISSAEEQNFVFSIFGGYGGSQRILWTGLYDPSQDATGTHANNFVWSSGAPIIYTNWDAGEPNNAGSEYYVAMYYPNYHNPGSWNDWSNRTADPIGIPFYGVVQFVPEPSTGLTLIGVGSVFFVRRRQARPTHQGPDLNSKF